MPAADLVRRYLDLMEARDIERASAMLDHGFSMTFPGSAPMHRLEELVVWAQGRYRFVKKSYEAFEELAGDGGRAVVYCRGTLSGQWPDGTGFEGIRFIDRFEVVDARIVRQDVWNDIGEVRAGSEPGA
jgi:hypothetical protein